MTEKQTRTVQWLTIVKSQRELDKDLKPKISPFSFDSLGFWQQSHRVRGALPYSHEVLDRSVPCGDVYMFPSRGHSSSPGMWLDSLSSCLSSWVSWRQVVISKHLLSRLTLKLRLFEKGVCVCGSELFLCSWTVWSRRRAGTWGPLPCSW